MPSYTVISDVLLKKLPGNSFLIFPIVKQSSAVLVSAVEHGERNITQLYREMQEEDRGGLAAIGGGPWAGVGRGRGRGSI